MRPLSLRRRHRLLCKVKRRRRSALPAKGPASNRFWHGRGLHPAPGAAALDYGSSIRWATCGE
jgi:hypothetical protein